MTYGQIGCMLGSLYFARRVGQAMANTPDFLDIPCHRVVNSKGELAPTYAFGGSGKQKEILEKEGVTFKENGCIDLEKNLYRIERKAF
jgi:methylated-DNA-protein-cysteine methyltransferase-like protein